jgi:hypothetical protein
MSQEPTIQPLETNSALYVLTDNRGNLMSVGQPEALQILMNVSQRCAPAPLTRNTVIEPVTDELN